MNREKKCVLNGLVEFSNGYPISLTVSSPIPFDKIRIIQNEYSEALGYPVLFLQGIVVKEGYRISMFHRDSVLKDDCAKYGFCMSFDTAEVVGLWDGESVTDLLKLIYGSEGSIPIPLYTRYLALQNKSFSADELRGHPIGIEESKSIDYFRDRQGRGSVVRYRNWHNHKIILAPTVNAILEIMSVSGHRSSYRIDRYDEIDNRVRSDYLSISNHNELHEKLKEFELMHSVPGNSY